MRLENERLSTVSSELEQILTRGSESPVYFGAAEICRETVWVTMRDGIRLATDLYRPPLSTAPAIVMRTPYGRAAYEQAFIVCAQHGYVVISQDCRGTGDSEPDTWDYYIYEPEDSVDLVDWIIQQEWFDGFVGGCGGSYMAATQVCLAAHPKMSTIVPEVGGLGITFNSVRYYMFLDSYARSVGKGAGKIPAATEVLERQMEEQTLAGGYFNETLHQPLSDALLARYPHLRTLPHLEAKRWLWAQYCALPPAARADLIKQALDVSDFTTVEMERLYTTFGYRIAYGAHSIPRTRPSDISRLLHAPALMITGWYDWGLNDTLATWELLMREASDSMRSRTRLVIAPSAHNMPGYHEGQENFPELQRNFRTRNIIELLLRWYASFREDTIESWPRVMYYLMGANEWYAASAWPPLGAQIAAFYLGGSGTLTTNPPHQHSNPDSYTYYPDDPTPTIGGSIVSSVLPPGSVDVSEIQRRPDVLIYTTAPLERDLDVVGPLRVILYASSTALDTDFSARLSDVFPDGRAIQLQSGILRARYRNPDGDVELLEPNHVYRLEIDLWATANRFRAGRCLRLDIASADFPRFDRNSNLGGRPGSPVPAVQTIYHDAERPSHLLVSIMGGRS